MFARGSDKACLLSQTRASQVDLVTRIKAAISISVICETDAPSRCLLGPAENNATEKLSLPSGLCTWMSTHVFKDRGQDDAQDLARHRESPTPQRFSGDDSLHETIPANGLNLNHNPYTCNLQVSFPVPVSEDQAMVSNYDNSKFFYYSKCYYLTRLHLEISAQLPCDSEFSSWDRSWDARSLK